MRTTSALLIAPLALGARAGLASDDLYYMYDGRPVPLTLDAETIAVFGGSDAVRTVAELIPGWRLLPADARVDGAFMSPVFRDARGGAIVPSRDLLVAFERGAAVSISPGFEIVDERVANMTGVLRVRARAGDGRGVLEKANRLAVTPGVRWAEPDFIFTGYAAVASTPGDPLYPDQWGLENTGQLGGVADVDTDAPDAWPLTTGDPGVPVVIFDVGVEVAHPDLNLAPGADFTTAAPAAPGQAVNECDIHGTWVAGVLAARLDNGLGLAGVAPSSPVASARIGISNTPACTLSWSGQLSWTVEAIDWAESIGARVTNNSNAYNITSSAIRERYEQTRAAGMVHFASAGNDFGAGATYPASLAAVNAVSAADRTGALASFSNDGSSIFLAGPGVDIVTTDRLGAPGGSSTEYAFVDGTSFASPAAAGVAQLLLSFKPDLTSEDAERVLARSAKDLGPPGRDSSFGWGMPDADAAIALGRDWRSWSVLPAPLSPTQRANAAMASSVDGSLYLFGGLQGPFAKNDLWRFDAGTETWSLVSATPGPSTRYGMAMAHDAVRNELVVHGGFAGSTASVETWVFEIDSQSWRLAATQGPSARFLHAAASDPDSGRVYLFGGRTASNQDLGDLWVWNGAAWAEIALAVGPSARHYHAMSFDAARAELLLHGGTVGSNETWAFAPTGETWTLRASDAPDRREHTLAFDASRAETLLFGGEDASGDALAELWAWDGSAWRLRSIQSDGPGPRSRHVSAALPDGRTLVVSGIDGSTLTNDAWAWRVEADCSGDLTAEGACAPDAPRDGVVTLSDFSCYLALWSAADARADITLTGVCAPGAGGDGVDLSDFSCYLAQWSAGCP